MKTFRGVILGICAAISISVFAASLWPNGPWLETFQNGFLFGNGSIFSSLNSVPKFDDRRLDDRNKDLYFQEDFEGGTVSFTCGANLTTTDETGSPIAGSTSKLITQAAGALNQVCESPTIVLDEKQKDSLNQVCINAVGENFDLIAYDSTNATELGRISIEDTSKTYCLEFLTIASTNAVTYRLEAVNEVVSSTLKYDDVQFKTNPLNAAQVFASTEWEAYTPTITGFGTTSSEDFKYRRLGDTIEVEGYFVSGTSTATEAQITLPNGYTIKQGALQNVGTWARDVAAGSSELGGFVLATSGDSFINLGDRGTFASSGTNPDAVDAAVGSRVVVSGNGVSLKYSVSVNELSNTFKSIVTNSGEADTEYYEAHHQANFWDGTGSVYTFDTGFIDLSDSNFIEWDDTTQTRLVAKQDVVVDVSIQSTSAADSSIYILKPGDLILAQNTTRTDATTALSTTAEVRLNAGEYIYFRATNAVSSTGGLVITARKATLGEYHLVPVSDQENVFSARIANNGTASITSESSPFIESVNRTGPGIINYVFKSGIFTVPPSVVPVVNENSGQTLSVYNVTTTGFTTVSVTSNGTSVVDTDVMLMIQKQGADYNEPKVFLGDVPVNYSQQKILSADVTTSTNPVTDLTFNNLVVGRRYRVDVQASFIGSSTGEGKLNIIHDGNIEGSVTHDAADLSTPFSRFKASSFAEFTATATSLTFNFVDAGLDLEGNNTKEETYAQLTELNHTRETSRF
jgi:hypothetical protein